MSGVTFPKAAPLSCPMRPPTVSGCAPPRAAQGLSLTLTPQAGSGSASASRMLRFHLHAIEWVRQFNGVVYVNIIVNDTAKWRVNLAAKETMARLYKREK